MRLVTFVGADKKPKAGALIEGDGKIVDLAAAGGNAPELASVLAMAESGDMGLERAAAAVRNAPAHTVLPRASVRLLAPIPHPPQMRDCMCFEKHLRQSTAAWRRMAENRAKELGRPAPPESKAGEGALKTLLKQPVYYISNRFAVIGPDEDIIWPHYSKLLDYELEFGVYLKKLAKDVPVDQAKDYIFGYSIFNDVSARDTQSVEMMGMLGPTKSKDFDTASPMGPCIVTPDELPDPYNLTMIARINGEEWGRGHSSEMHWKFEDLIAFISRSESLYPGEFLGSGTVGNGCGLEQLRFLNPGDLIELEVEGIGILRNRIVKPA